jgi:hypothetical protein
MSKQPCFAFWSGERTEMKASEVIEQLESLIERHGDIDVLVCEDSDREGMYRDVTDVSRLAPAELSVWFDDVEPGGAICIE